MMLFILGAFFTLSSSLLLSVSHSLHCDSETQSPRTVENGQKCMCKPGEYLVGYCSASSQTRCKECMPGFYNNCYNVERSCHQCHDCSMNHLVSKKQCTRFHNSECDCEEGYRCKSEPCLECEKITSPEADKNITTATEVSRVTRREVKNNQRGEEVLPSVWFPSFVFVVCFFTLLICVILASRHKNGILRARQTAKGFLVAKKNNSAQSVYRGGGKRPIQEVCDKLEV
ncbi:hypothetical protein AAFF_G00070980 [Aldrovandia affinis]|uniref:TNFR-Cys domain-containing protein n=1 Tax=Aldrovandia affinis TaxID=143900 RepID=A0AAD7WEE6_9TELE|nr:hypothetical protein AAFF_G00070980 [Aldrovandia affinis]